MEIMTIKILMELARIVAEALQVPLTQTGLSVICLQSSLEAQAAHAVFKHLEAAAVVHCALVVQAAPSPDVGCTHAPFKHVFLLPEI